MKLRDKSISNRDKAYIAGFLDGDGSIFCQIVKCDYTFGYRVRVTVGFYQDTSRYWFLMWLQKQLRYGTLRRRPDGVSEYIIVNDLAVKSILLILLPYLRVKKKAAVYALDVINRKGDVSDALSFIKLCELVDKSADENFSKKRTVTSAVVRNYLVEKGCVIEDSP